jgi:hypothetical protein
MINRIMVGSPAWGLVTCQAVLRGGVGRGWEVALAGVATFATVTGVGVALTGRRRRRVVASLLGSQNVGE